MNKIIGLIIAFFFVVAVVIPNMISIGETNYNFIENGYENKKIKYNASPETISVNENKRLTASFSRDQYTLTIHVNGSGNVIKNPEDFFYSYGTMISLTSNPGPGWSFDHWSGDLNGEENPISITIIENITIYAHFKAPSINLTLPWNIIIGPHQMNTPAIRPTFVSDPYATEAFPDVVEQFRPFVNHLHNHSMKSIEFHSFDHVEHPEAYTRVPELEENATVIDLDGNKIEDYYIPGYYRLCINRPFYRNFIVNTF